MDIVVKFDGKQLEKQLKGISRRAQGQSLKKAAKAGAKPVVDSAKRKVPVDKGLTQRYIRHWTGKYKTTEVTENIGVTAKSRRMVAKYLEEGTSKMAARPYLRPAMDENIKKAAEETNREMVEQIMEEVRRNRH